MMQKLISGIFALIFLASLVNTGSAQTSQKPKSPAVPAGFKQSPNGLIYKYVRQTKSGKKPLASDVMTLNLNYALYKGAGKDSVMFDSKKTPQGELMVQLNPFSYKGDIMEGLAMLENGDSASFIVPADSFFIRTAGAPELPPGLRAGDRLLFQVGLTKFSTLEQLQSEKAEMDSIAKSEEILNLRKYIFENKITEQPKPSGLIILMQVEGAGEKPQSGQKVTVHYTGYLLNGSKFDSSVDRGQPFTFTLGQGQVIKGWDEGIAELKPGSKAKLIIPSSIGYGAQGAGANIPPYSTLIFEVELIKAE
jgi:FKBP-type peptidyl-prolyl cis-trans isomerase FkpA